MQLIIFNILPLLLFAACIAAESPDTTKDAVLLKTFDDVKNALLAGQHLTAWADFGGCKVLGEEPAVEVVAGHRQKHAAVGKADPGLVSWTQKYTIWQWMSKIEDQEVVLFPSHQALGSGFFASENVLLWQNGTVILDIVSWTSGPASDRNVTQVVLNCTLGTSAAFRGWTDLKKPIDTAANAIAASKQQGAELSAVIVYDACSKIGPADDEEGDAIQAISGQAMTDAVIATDEKGDLLYMGSASFLERTPDDNFRAFGDDVAILTNGTVYVDTFIDFFLGSNVVHRDYYAECEFGKSVLVFA